MSKQGIDVKVCCGTALHDSVANWMQAQLFRRQVSLLASNRSAALTALLQLVGDACVCLPGVLLTSYALLLLLLCQARPPTADSDVKTANHFSQVAH
jgi:hypothetical protein